MLSKKIKLNLNFRLVVIFVLRLAKPLSEKRNCSAKVEVTQYGLRSHNLRNKKYRINSK